VYAKTAEPFKKLLELTHVSSRKRVLDEGQGRTNPFAVMRGDKMAIWPFVKIL